ncbi:unnamed protein product [Sphagnum jensenii]|uniref:Uncharacterized protein n=1 Tax=Sphagnum jensenii TaxID=128206 RepID=A0ABP1AVP4_9BRYO
MSTSPNGLPPSTRVLFFCCNILYSWGSSSLLDRDGRFTSRRSKGLRKLSRNEEQLDLSAEEQENGTEAVRQKLEALLPKRPLKPARSEAQQLAAAVQESETPPSFRLKIHNSRMSIIN